MLHTILDKGLADITPNEHDTIRKKWILMNQEPSISKTVWIIIFSTLALGIISMLVVLAWNRSLARIVTKRSIELTAELTHRRQAEESMRKTLAEKETLIRELYHRTKNNLQIVSSLMNLKTHKSAPETRAFVSEINQRIQGLSLIHQMLYESHDLSTLDLSDYLKKLVDLIVLNLWGQRSAVTVNFSADVLPVTLDIASPCGLVINELLSNTFKYAFADGRHGVITIKLSLDGPGRILIEYSDNGVGLPDGFDPRQQLTLGFQSLFAIIEHQLAGDVRVISKHGLGFIMKIASTHYKERV
jgi:two-component sensor histidine kinase